MMLWLPLFSGAALASSITMQLPHGSCHERMADEALAHDDIGAHHQHHGGSPATSDDSGSSCSTCGVCHLACTGYLSVTNFEAVVVPAVAMNITSGAVSYRSITFAPLLPPPLARA